MNSMPRTNWRIFGTLLVLVAIAAWPAFQVFHTVRLKAHLSASRAKLKQIGVALHQYHDKYECFPPAYVQGPDNKPWHSWRVLLLPFLDEQELYERYRFDEPWDGPHNRELQAHRPEVYASGLQQSPLKSVTTYLGVVSRRTMWPANYCVKISDVTDGTSNTIMLLENASSDVVWSEPREMREKDALALLRPDNPDQPSKPFPYSIPALFADASVRVISPQIGRDLFVSLLTPKYGQFVVTEGWPQDEGAASRLPDVVDASHYPNTQILSAPDSPVVPDKTSVYSATVQLAWDLLRPAAAQPVVVTNGTPIIDAMNSHPFPLTALARESYFAGVSGLAADESATLFEDFRRRFPDAPVEMLASPDTLPGTRVFTYLQKSLPFPEALERFPAPLPFRSGEQPANVNSFGSPSHGETDHKSVFKDVVEVCDYTSREDFIVRLKTDGAQSDEIILARIKPEGTLRATWNTVLQRIQSPNAPQVVRELRRMDRLQIPIISFGVTSPLPELIGLEIPTPTKPDRFIADARQTMRFRLDEYGAELIADTHLVVGEFGGDKPPFDPSQPRDLIFDGPFLLVLKEKSASVPYFLAWVGNTDLMELAK